jgi:ubiquinone/menaquinone biosynthesis C-methylase UbiE|tara:strand:- start:1329 stop:2078 length:750 start_codon:yes stop_codon:yes gene_type:complete
MNRALQNKKQEEEFWNKVSKQRVYAAFDEDEYEDCFDWSIGKRQNKKIIDIGSASGISAALLAKKGAQVLGIDLATDLVSQANNLWRDLQTKLKFKVGDAENLKLPSKSFDVCFFGGVIHHFPDKTKLVKESKRILKKGGTFIAIEPNLLDFFERIEWKLADIRNKLSPNEFPINPVDFKIFLEKNGFKNVSFKLIRSDIPFLAQLPILKIFFNRKKGFLIKKPLISLTNLFRKDSSKGNFFIIKAQKK